MNDFLVKPFLEDDLRLLLRKWIVKNEPVKYGASKKKITNIHFDIYAVRECVGDNKIAEHRILTLLIEELKVFRNEFRQLIATKDRSGLSAAKHKLRGTCSNTGLSELEKLITQYKINESADFQKCRKVELMIIDEINTIVKIIKRHLQEKVSH